MSLPSSMRKFVENRLQEYCGRKFPPEVHNDLKLKFKIRGNSVTLFEERKSFSDLTKLVDTMVAQFRFDPDTQKWTLYWAGGDDRWHKYDGLSPNMDLDVILAEIDEDPTGIFWG